MDNSCPKQQNDAQFAIGRYKKSGSAGIKGLDYQIGLLVVVLLNAVRKLSNWRLSTENESAGKFDDVVVEWPEGAILIQAKHREKKKKGITLDELMSVNSKRDEFSLPKYFLSYHGIKNNFVVKDIIICTNANVHEKVLPFLNHHSVSPESILYHQAGKCSFYTFNDKIIPVLKQTTRSYFRQNFQGKHVKESVITDENLRDFLAHLQIYFDYPPDDNMEKVVEKLLSLTACSIKPSASEVSLKIKRWFLQKEGEYFSEIHAKSAFAEIRSDKYLQDLKKYNVSFENNSFSFNQTKKILQVVYHGGYLLQVLNIVEAFQDQKSKILCVDPKEGVEALKQAVDAFELPNHTVLLIIWFEDIEEVAAKEISYKLRNTLDRYEYKKVILVSENEVLQQLGLYAYNDKVKVSVTLKNVSPDTRNELLQRKNIVFQGRNISLDKVFANQVPQGAITSEILEKLILDKKIKVGSEVVPLHERIAPHYVLRTFEREEEEVDPEQLINVTRRRSLSEDNIWEICEKVVLIQDDAGAGKSTVLVHLANTIKKKNPDLWVVLITLNDYTGILNEFKENYKKTITIKDLLNSRSTTKLTNKLEELVFFESEKVVLLIDGVDEISPDYTELVLNLLSQCQRKFHFAKLFVTTRPHMAEQLEGILNTSSFKLQPFTHQNQINFLANYWCHNLKLNEDNRKRCERYAEELLKNTFFLVNLSNEQHFAAMPLQVMMLAEIFGESTRLEGITDWEGCREFLNGKEEAPNFLRKVNAVEIYKMFIQKKQSVYKIKGNPIGNTAANQALLNQFDECLAYHRRLALQEILQESEYKLFSDFRKSDDIDEATILRIGIVHKSQNQFYFCHRTFAEYFVAESIIRELQLQMRRAKKKINIILQKVVIKSIPCNQHRSIEFQKLFFNQILLTPRFKVVRTFFDGFLQPVVDSFPSDLFEYYESSSHKIDLDANYNLVRDLTKDGCVAILQLLFSCIGFETVTDREVNKEDFLVNFSKPSNILKGLKFLARQGGVNIRDGFYRKPLCFALGSNNMEMIKFLVSHGATIFDSMLYDAIYKNQVEMVTYLLEKIIEKGGSVEGHPLIPYTLCYLGRTDQLRHLVENSLDVNHRLENEESLIFGAVRGGQLDTIRYLAQQGADINSRDRSGNSALHLIVGMPSSTLTAELLVQLGIDVNVCDFSGSTALHMSTKNVEMVKLLVNYGADVNTKDSFGKTVLCKAIQQSHWDSAKFLVEQGCDVNIRDNEGGLAIHYAAEEGGLDVIHLLLRGNTCIENTIMLKTIHGYTPLHFAAIKGRFETVRYFVERSVDVSVRNNEGRTALHLAAWKGHFQTVKYLVQHGADVNAKDVEGRTALHLAAVECQLEVVEYLSELCKDLNARDNQGCTVLNLAAWKGRISGFRYTDYQSFHFGVPTSRVQHNRNVSTKIVKLLVEKGADDNIRTSNEVPVIPPVEKTLRLMHCTQP